jgi:hypothetical protein
MLTLPLVYGFLHPEHHLLAWDLGLVCSLAHSLSRAGLFLCGHTTGQMADHFPSGWRIARENRHQVITQARSDSSGGTENGVGEAG